MKPTDLIKVEDALEFAEYFRNYFEYWESNANGRVYMHIVSSSTASAKTIIQIFKEWVKNKQVEKKEGILPCPFCGSECKVINDNLLGGDDYRVVCNNGHKLDHVSGTEEEAIKEWNKRV